MGVAGDPDIDACVRGRSVQLEVKRPGERPTPLQFKRIEEWRRAGAVAAVVNSVEDVRRLLQENHLLDRTTEVELANIVSEKSFVR
jgi:hypothetical protein